MKFKRLNEIASVVDSLHQTPKYSENGIPMVRVTDIKGGRLSLRDCLKVDEEIYEKFTSNHKPQYGDIIVSRVGTYGVFSFVATNDRFCLGQNTAIITPHINSDFVYYCLISQIVKIQIEKKVVGSTQKTLSLKSIRELAIPDIDNDTQLIVSSILKCIDKRIALNSMINDNLEQQAQAIFKSWFVDFELFGGIMPDDWTTDQLGSFVTIKRGGSPRPIKDYLSDNGYRWLKISDVTSLNSPYILEIKEHIKETGLKKTVFLKQGSLVLSNSATPGIPKILDVDSCIHDGWLYFPESKLSNEYLYLLFKMIRKDLVVLGNGSVFTRVCLINRNRLYHFNKITIEAI